MKSVLKRKLIQVSELGRKLAEGSLNTSLITFNIPETKDTYFQALHGPSTLADRPVLVSAVYMIHFMGFEETASYWSGVFFSAFH